MQLNILAYKLDSGLWAFDHTHRNTIGELLCGGTELVIDRYFHILNGRDANIGDTIKFHLEDRFFSGCNTMLQKLRGGKYFDDLLKMEVWLCPWLEGYFGVRPATICVKVLP